MEPGIAILYSPRKLETGSKLTLREFIYGVVHGVTTEEGENIPGLSWKPLTLEQSEIIGEELFSEARCLHSDAMELAREDKEKAAVLFKKAHELSNRGNHITSLYDKDVAEKLLDHGDGTVHKRKDQFKFFSYGYTTTSNDDDVSDDESDRTGGNYHGGDMDSTADFKIKKKYGMLNNDEYLDYKSSKRAARETCVKPKKWLL